MFCDPPLLSPLGVLNVDEKKTLEDQRPGQQVGFSNPSGLYCPPKKECTVNLGASSQVIKVVRVSVFPGSQDTQIACFSIFPGSRVITMDCLQIFHGSK